MKMNFDKNELIRFVNEINKECYDDCYVNTIYLVDKNGRNIFNTFNLDSLYEIGKYGIQIDYLNYLSFYNLQDKEIIKKFLRMYLSDLSYESNNTVNYNYQNSYNIFNALSYLDAYFKINIDVNNIINTSINKKDMSINFSCDSYIDFINLSNRMNQQLFNIHSKNYCIYADSFYSSENNHIKVNNVCLNYLCEIILYLHKNRIYCDDYGALIMIYLFKYLLRNKFKLNYKYDMILGRKNLKSYNPYLVDINKYFKHNIKLYHLICRYNIFKLSDSLQYNIYGDREIKLIIKDYKNFYNNFDEFLKEKEQLIKILNDFKDFYDNTFVDNEYDDAIDKAIYRINILNNKIHDILNFAIENDGDK